MSEIDRIYDEREARRAALEMERRERFEIAAHFLTEFYENDVGPSRTLADHGIEAHFSYNRIVFHLTAAGPYADPFQIAVGEQGEIDVGGRSLGRYTQDDKVKMRRELIGEILTFFDL
jgi:hypothetical protein